MKARGLLLLFLGCTAGCTTGLLESGQEPPEVYRLDAPAIEARAAAVPESVVVPRLRAPASLNTERIAVLRPGHRFDYFEGVRWSDTAPVMLQQLLVATLSRNGHFAVVVAAPARLPTDYTLDVELRRFEAVYSADDSAPTVIVELQGTLVGSRQSRTVASLTAEASAKAADTRRAAVIEAFNRATSAALGDLAARLREVPPSGSPQ